MHDASGAYGESNVIWVRDSDSVRDRVKVRVTSVVLVMARVMFRDVTRHRRTRRRRTHQTHFTVPEIGNPPRYASRHDTQWHSDSSYNLLAVSLYGII